MTDRLNDLVVGLQQCRCGRLVAAARDLADSKQGRRFRRRDRPQAAQVGPLQLLVFAARIRDPQAARFRPAIPAAVICRLMWPYEPPGMQIATVLPVAATLAKSTAGLPAAAWAVTNVMQE